VTDLYLSSVTGLTALSNLKQGNKLPTCQRFPWHSKHGSVPRPPEISIDEAGDSIARFGTLALSSPFSSLSAFIFRPVDQPSLGNNLNQRLLSFYATPTRCTRHPDRHSDLREQFRITRGRSTAAHRPLSFTEPANHRGSRYQKQRKP